VNFSNYRIFPQLPGELTIFAEIDMKIFFISIFGARLGPALGSIVTLFAVIAYLSSDITLKVVEGHLFEGPRGAI
jgi:hypothetical protein